MLDEELLGSDIAPGEPPGRLHLEDGIGVGIAVLLVFPMTLHKDVVYIFF